MVSETKKAVFGLSSTTDEATGAEAKVAAATTTTTKRFIFDVIASLTVLYFYTLLYVIPHYLLTKIATFACAAWARFTATERFQQCKGCIGTKSEQIWTQRLAPIVSRVQDKVTGMRFYPLLKEKAVFVYETLIVSVIELVKGAALTVTKRLTAIWNDKSTKMFECVNWSVNNLTAVKQHIVELKACKQTAQFVQQAVIARAVAVWNTQLLVLMTVVKQAVMGKLNKKVTIVQQPQANTVQFEEVKATEAIEAPAPVETITTTSDAPAEATTTTSSDSSMPVNRKLVFATAEPVAEEQQQAPTVAQTAEPVAEEQQQQQEAPKQQAQVEQQQPLLQPAAPVAVEEPVASEAVEATTTTATTPVPAASHEEQEAEHYEQQPEQQHHGASPRKHGKKHKNKNK